MFLYVRTWRRDLRPVKINVGPLSARANDGTTAFDSGIRVQSAEASVNPCPIGNIYGLPSRRRSDSVYYMYTYSHKSLLIARTCTAVYVVTLAEKLDPDEQFVPEETADEQDEEDKSETTRPSRARSLRRIFFFLAPAGLYIYTHTYIVK